MTQSTLQGVVDGLKAELDPTYALRIEEAPGLHDVYPHLAEETAQDPFTPFTAKVLFNDTDKAMYLHSSGSTGLPKPILFTHRLIKDDASISECLWFSVSLMS